MRRLALTALAALGGCTASRPVDVPAPTLDETRAEAVAPVVRLVAGQPDTLLVQDLLGPNAEATWGDGPRGVRVADLGDGRIVLSADGDDDALSGPAGLVLVPYAVGRQARALAVEVTAEPTVTFAYDLTPGAPAPAEVFVIGGFNDWSRTADRLVPDGRGGLSASRRVAPGRYEYKLVVDGAEVLDPASRDSVQNPFGAYNNVLVVEAQTRGRVRLGAPVLSDDAASLRFEFAIERPLDAVFRATEAVVLVDNTPVNAEFVTVEPVRNASAEVGTVAVDLAAVPPGVHRLRVALVSGGLVSRWAETLVSDGQPLGATQVVEGAPEPFVWQDAVVYQVVLDRFRNGDPANDRPVVTDGLLPPANYHGGDLQGLLDVIEDGYFERLGVNTLWLSPVYDNPPGAEREFPEPHRLYTGYHGYWPANPRAVDEHLGDMTLLRQVVSQAHARSLRVLLDVVAHHTHDSHPYFQQHPDWYGQLELPGGSLNLRRFDEYRLTTWFEPYLPSFDFEGSPQAVAQIADDAVWWLRETGADGFRHDAVKHVPNAFWRALTARVADENTRRDVPVYQIGETFGSYGLVSSYVVPGQLDAQFNFLLYDAAISALARGGSMRVLADEMDRSLAVFGPLHVMGNLLDSHDKTRFMAYADGDVPPGTDEAELGWGPDAPRVDDRASYQKMELAMAYLLTTPGVPVVYYGDEVGLTGAADPDNRRDFPWDDTPSDADALREATAQLAALRRDLPALRHGALDTVEATETLWVFRRTSPTSEVVVALNTGAAEARVAMPGLAGATDALDASLPIGADVFTVPARSYRILTLR